MERNEGDKEWATFGKATAWVVGLGVVGTGIYFGGKALYDNGYENAQRDQAYSLRSESGLKIPGTCFTLAETYTSTQTQYVLSADNSCDGLQIKIPKETDYTKTQRGIEVVVGQTKTTIQNQSPYTTTERWDSGWLKIE